MIITVEFEKNSDGTFEAWIGSEYSSGLHYKSTSAERIGEIVGEEIKEMPFGKEQTNE